MPKLAFYLNPDKSINSISLSVVCYCYLLSSNSLCSISTIYSKLMLSKIASKIVIILPFTDANPTPYNYRILYICHRSNHPKYFAFIWFRTPKKANRCHFSDLIKCDEIIW